MAWYTTADLDRFLTVTGEFLRAHAAENIVLLSAARRELDRRRRGARCDDPLYGWWEPEDGTGPRGAFLHHPSERLLIAVRAPEAAAAL
ncbi:MAG: hypothetical protein J2P25_18405, partial [Nocardiopsaceae bacterium]|nr:hypothetical protein [Nocardiopsaceae bacterium]